MSTVNPLNTNPDISKAYELLIDTLIMACLDQNVVTREEADGYLEELEGDAHTFLDYVNVMPLHEAGLLSKEHVETITQLKFHIYNIPSSLWNIASVQNHDLWKRVRIQADEILTSLGIEHRRLE